MFKLNHILNNLTIRNEMSLNLLETNERQWLFSNLNDSDAIEVAKHLKSTPNLLALTILTGMKLNAGMGVAGGKAILKAVRKHPSITYLNLQGNDGMGDKVGIAIYKMLVGNKSLTTLSLSDCGLTDKTAGLIAEGIKLNSSLKELHLYNNCFSKGVELIENAAKERSVPLIIYKQTFR